MKISNLLASKEHVDFYLQKEKHALSSFSFVNIFIWKDFFDFEFREIDGCLCVFAKDQAGVFMYLPPLGKSCDSEITQKCFFHMWEINGESGLSRIENLELNSLPQLNQYCVLRKSADYCYKRKDIAELKGNLYKSKRLDYNHFTSSDSYRFMPFEKSMLKECAALYEAWRAKRHQSDLNEMYHYMLDDNVSVHQTAMEYFKELGLTGWVVKIEDKIKAYTFGYRLNKDMFCVLFEITDDFYGGLPVFIFREVCSDAKIESYEWINVMDDFGLPNLKFTKESFRPRFMVPSYNLKMKNDHGDAACCVST